MREQGFITPAQEEAARARAPAHPAVPPAAATRARGWAKDYLRQQFRNEFGGDNPPDWQVHTTFLPALQDAAERAVAAGLERLRRPGLEAALVAIDPATGDILAMVGGANYARSTFNRAVAQPAAAGIGVQAARLRGGARARLLAGVGAVEPAARHRRRAIPSGRRATRDGEQPDELTLRAALLESNNAGRRRSAAAGRLARRSCGWPATPGSTACPTCRRSRSAPASSRRSISPRPTRCFPAAGRSRGRAA